MRKCSIPLFSTRKSSTTKFDRAKKKRRAAVRRGPIRWFAEASPRDLCLLVFCPIGGIWGRGYEKGWVSRNGWELEAERGKKNCRIYRFVSPF
ncbi:hypothetical protein SLEP1_g56382 [Rubroshorea leprosula]|uniref:Uncharacterized protein n=1 Tax=Rubroshorea leprosula TaxID=152421 RepID=A0AAV5MJG8_9ROSI|nr:hypothetical protein SLEP1_g56382 [Rubroshorea leprosula]